MTKRRKEQINVAITDELRSIMDARAKAAGHGLSEEARILLWAGLATLTGKPDFNSDWAREVALTHAAWMEGAA